MNVPYGIDWEIDRLVMSGKFPGGYTYEYILHQCTYERLLDMHALLDMEEELDRKVRRAQEAQKTRK